MLVDDVCVFGRPNISGLQCLLTLCCDYATEHETYFDTLFVI